jgi:hypothetical protein
MTAPVALRFGADVCQNWREAALYYGVDYANAHFPGCVNGQLVGPVAQVFPPPPPIPGVGDPVRLPPTIGGPGSSVQDGCGCSEKAAPPVVVAGGSAPAPVVPAASGAPPAPKRKPFPWWLVVLALLILARSTRRD